MKKRLGFALTLLSLTAHALVEPTASTKAISKDPFSVYQWALLNQGQSQTRNHGADDLSSVRVTGTPGYDLGLDPAVDYDALMKRETVVALLDTGADTTHEDLQGAFALNLAECENTKTPSFARGDRDGNGYLSDCLGWDFTQNTQRMTDPQGHGTHLSAIIAAVKNNSRGIRGISNRVKVLPLPVMGASLTWLAERVQKALRYAIDRRVDVINMSMGWPLAEDNAGVRALVREAIAKNIAVVAAAGNDGTNEPVFPCTYPGVICVGSADLQGRLSADSNFGAQVDFLAPGEDILSAIPKGRTSTSFAVPGYDFLSGSSQSAAEISGLLAVLRGIYPAEKVSTLYARLALSARMNRGAKDVAFALHGIPSLKKALNVSSQALVQPVMKEDHLLYFNKNGETLTFPLTVQNLGTVSGTVQVRVSAKSATVALDYRTSLAALAFEEQRRIDVPLQIKNADGDNQVDLTIEIEHGGATVSYRHHVTLVRKFSTDAATAYDIVGARTGALGARVNGRFKANLTALRDPQFKLGGPTYYSFDPVSASFALLKKDGAHFRFTESAALTGASRINGVYVTDINLDGRPDLMVYAEASTAKPGFAAADFYLFDLDLKPLLGRASRWHLEWNTDSEAPPAPAVFAYIPAQVNGLGRIALPAQVLSGLVPAADQKSGVLSANTLSNGVHFYYFWPEVSKTGVTLVKRLIDTQDFRADFAARLGLTWREDLRPILSAGTPARVLLSVTKGAKETVYQVEAKDLSAWRERNFKLTMLPSLNYAWSRLNLTDVKYVGTKGVAQGIASGMGQQLDPQRLRWAFWRGDKSEARVYNLKVADEQDHLEKLSSLYLRSDGSLSAYVLTRDALQEQTVRADGTSAMRSMPIARFTYVPSELMNLVFVPTYTGNDQNSAAAFYVDKTALNQPYVYVIRTEGSAISASANTTLEIPANCMALDPGTSERWHQSLLQMVCDYGSVQRLLHIPL